MRVHKPGKGENDQTGKLTEQRFHRQIHFGDKHSKKIGNREEFTVNWAINVGLND